MPLYLNNSESLFRPLEESSTFLFSTGQLKLKHRMQRVRERYLDKINFKISNTDSYIHVCITFDFILNSKTIHTFKRKWIPDNENKFFSIEHSLKVNEGKIYLNGWYNFISKISGLAHVSFKGWSAFHATDNEKSLRVIHGHLSRYSRWRHRQMCSNDVNFLKEIGIRIRACFDYICISWNSPVRRFKCLVKISSIFECKSPLEKRYHI